MTTATATIMTTARRVGTQRDAERRRPAAEQVRRQARPTAASSRAMAIAMARPAAIVTMATRCALRPPSTSPISTPTNGTSTAAGEQQPAGCGHGLDRHALARAPGPLSAAGGGESDASVVDLVSSNRRSSTVTASAVAEKATTMPVMSNACGTGSPPMPAAAPRRAMTPNKQEHAAADDVEREDLAQRLRVDDEAVEADARRARPLPVRRASLPLTAPPPVRGVPAMMQAERQRERRHQRDLDHDDQRLCPAVGIAEERAGRQCARDADGDEHERARDEEDRAAIAG